MGTTKNESVHEGRTLEHGGNTGYVIVHFFS